MTEIGRINVIAKNHRVIMAERKCYHMRITMQSSIPPSDYTNQQWQNDLAELKEKIEPSPRKRMVTIRESAKKTESGSYYGKTQYQYYCAFINDILEQIRSGQEAFCYYVYQVIDVLRFEKEVDVNYIEKYRYFFLHKQ